MSRDDPPPYARAIRETGFVVIGRNEGERLRACLNSVCAVGARTVYVDSGSRDNSVALAQAFGLPVVELDPATPFTAARARNAGVEWLAAHAPGIAFIHFIDGDCELVADWFANAHEALAAEPMLGAVCGRRRERHPGASPYNWLCDDEWNTPVGIADTCGGDALFRLEAFWAGSGFSPELIAGEEPDLCHRVRAAGWRIRRIDRDMTVHDAAMTRFAQWWQRNRRSGYATAEALARRGKRNPRMWREVLSNLFWALPIVWPLWPLLWLRVLHKGGAVKASFITIGKVPHLQGQVDFWRRRRSRLIEYK